MIISLFSIFWLFFMLIFGIPIFGFKNPAVIFNIFSLIFSIIIFLILGGVI